MGSLGMSQNKNRIWSRFFEPTLKPKIILLNCLPVIALGEAAVAHAGSVDVGGGLAQPRHCRENGEEDDNDGGPHHFGLKVQSEMSEMH